MTGPAATSTPRPASTATTAPAPLALCGATVVTALHPVAVRRADVVIADGRVASVGRAPAGARRRDCSGTLVLPGNVCAHHHLYSALARGMPLGLPAPTSFLQTLRRLWWRLDRSLDLESVRASALRGGLEAVLAGTTTVVDHHASPNAVDGSLDVVADALAELGLRSVLCYEVSDRDGPAVAAAGLAENRRFLATRRPLARGLVGAHASFTLSDDTLAACVDAAAAAGVGVHIHVAEDGCDQRDAAARGAFSVVRRLDAAGVLAPGALLAHAVHVDGTEVDLVAAAGATVVVNPRSNMNNGVGHSPFAGWPGRVALGTDGIGGDMFAESQVGFFRGREVSHKLPPEWPLARLAAGAAVAARSFGEPLLGSLRAGAPADLVVADYPAVTPLAADTLAGHWVFGLSAARMRDVYVAGEPVVLDRRSTRVDEAELAAGGLAAARRLWARVADEPEHPFQPLGGEVR